MNNKWFESRLEACSLSKADIFQELRNSMGVNNLEGIKKIILERNGKISFLKEIR